MCPHVIVKNYEELPVCTIGNHMCYYMRRCRTDKSWKAFPEMYTCSGNLKPKKGIDMGKNRVRFTKSGFLYVEYNNSVVKIKNPYDIEPSSVDVVEADGGLYIKGYEPKVKKIKKQKEKTEDETKE